MIYEKRLTPIQVARELRKNMTPGERLLWVELRRKKLNGYKFLRQYPVVYDAQSKPVKFYVLDFYCASRRIAIELDGEIHQNQKDYDNKRTFDISWQGIRILRIKNEELSDMGKVKKRILELLKT